MEKEAVSVFRELAKYPQLVSASLHEQNGDILTVESSWSQRCLEKNTSHNFLRSYTLKSSSLDVISKSRPHIAGECAWNLPSPTGKKCVTVRKHVPDKSKPTDDKWFFEIWSCDGHCDKVVDVTSCDKHGAVYGDDGAFGMVAWNLTEDKIVYVAEKKPQKGASFFVEPKKQTDEGKDEPIVGAKFLHKEDWGEMLVGKEHSVICVLDIVSGEVTVVMDDMLADASAGQVVWSPNGDGLVFCAYPHKPCKLGIIHCPIRRSMLYYYNSKTNVLKSLSGEGELSVRSPRFSPDGLKLVYLECKAGGPHCKSQKLKLISWPTGERRTVVDVVHSPAADADFYGIYCQFLPTRCWNAASSHVFLSTPARSRRDTFAVNVSTGKVNRLTEEAATWVVRDVCGDLILISVSKIDSPTRLAIGNLSDFDEGRKIQWKYLDSESRLTDIKWEFMTHKPLIPHSTYSSLTYESVVLQPVDMKSKGLIVFPHGGPHTVFTTLYQLYFAFLAKLGFTVALVNYRGSTGFGEDSINSLIGFIGDSDIKDVQQCAEEVLEKYDLDRERVVALGGSHGGFLTAHLIGQYPDFYKAAGMRNPVTNLVSMAALTDIPDWIQTEIGYDQYVPCKVPNQELYSKMYSMSPVAHVHKVKAPTMVMLGQVDRRVPPSQGIEFHKALTARGIPSKLYIYPDNSHPIISIEAESDSIVNLYVWFVSHLGESS